MLPVRTRRGPSSPGLSASGRSGGGTIPRAHWRLWVLGRGRPPRASVAPGSVLGMGPHRAGFPQSAPDPLRVERPVTLPGTLPAASGGRPRVAVPSAGSRTTRRSGGLSPRWMQSRPRHHACPVPQPPRSLRSSLRHLWDVGWKDDAGLRLRTPGSGPGSTSNYRSRPFAAPPGPRQRDARAR